MGEDVKRKPSAAELWRKLVEDAGDDLIDQAASVSVAQAERDLRAAGFDMAAERARAEALLDALEAPRPRASKPR